MEEMEMISFEIISNVGVARSCFVDAIKLARLGEYEKAKQKIKEGEKSFLDGHNAHMKLLEVCKDSSVGLLVVHAESQLMSAETFKILAYELIEMYKCTVRA